MEYITPELVVLGSTSTLVLGSPDPGEDDNGSSFTRPTLGIVLGLDD